MNQRYPFIFALLLLLGSFVPAAAQQLWSRAYGVGGNQTFSGIHCLRDETVLLHGSSVTGSQPAKLLLIRVNTQGDTIRTRQLGIRGFDRFYTGTLLAEDNAGRAFIAGQVMQTGNIATLSIFATLLNPSTGDTLWTRVFPGTTVLSDVACTPNQEYVLAGQVQGHPTLIRLSATGQLLQQTTVDYSPTVPGAAGRMARGAGGYWLTVSNTSSNPVSVKFISDAGVLGSAYNLPIGLQSIGGIIAVEDGNFIVTSQSFISKFSPTFSLLWSAIPPVGATRQLYRPVRNTNGEYVFTSWTDASGHTQENQLVRYSPQGTYLDHFLLTGSSNYTYGLSVHPTTGNYYAGYGFTRSTGTLNDLGLSVFRGAAVTAATPPTASWVGTAYPNPVGADGTLHLQPGVPLAGPLLLTDALGRAVRQWPARPAATRYELPLQGLSAGLYQLRLTNVQGRPATLRVVKN